MIYKQSLFFAIALVISVVSLANPSPVVSVASIEASGEKVVMTDQGYSEGRIVQRFEQGTTLLYQSQVKNITYFKSAWKTKILFVCQRTQKKTNDIFVIFC
jgi:hypothetical protein